MKITNIVLAVLFFLFAAVQYNDPDPWLWIGLYCLVAIISLLAASGRYFKWLILGGLGICLVWLALLLPDFINWINGGMPSITSSMKAEEPHIELTREFLGLVICIAALIFHWIKSRKV
ncbi:MAG: transmembrane 220 family protein [Bacteroidota bacterium]